MLFTSMWFDTRDRARKKLTRPSGGSVNYKHAENRIVTVGIKKYVTRITRIQSSIAHPLVGCRAMTTTAQDIKIPAP
jgi:hypothetical protein